jgi:hypothetical protein
MLRERFEDTAHAGAAIRCLAAGRRGVVTRLPRGPGVQLGAIFDVRALLTSGSAGKIGAGSVILFPPILAGHEKPPQDLAHGRLREELPSYHRNIDMGPPS